MKGISRSTTSGSQALEETEPAGGIINSASAGAQLLAALEGQIDPVPTPVMYRVAAILVAATMLVLPAIYLGLIALVAWGVYWHAVNDVGILEGAQISYLGLLLYFSPIVVGIILILFMVKPIFARNSRQSPPLLMEREKEPLLYTFVEQLCVVVGSPKPRRIYVDCQVNAAAGMSGGILGWILGRVDLHLGLPLVAAMDIRQVAGIMAHEMGHFSQGTATRMNYIVRRINHGFARVIYHRDNWDRKLFGWRKRQRYGPLVLIGLLCVLAVSLVRRILWCLLMAGHAISAFLTRQQEFDADRYFARLSGADAFVEGQNRMGPLQAAMQTALGELDIAWREGQLADDLPLFVRTRDAAMPAEVREKLLAIFSKAKTRWFNTHPSHSDRVARVRQENAAGIFAVDAPASVLFSDFKETCRLATIMYYQRMLGPRLKAEHLHATEDISAQHDVRREKQSAARRYFQGLLSALRPIFPEPSAMLPKDADEGAMFIMQARSALMEGAESATAAGKAFDQASRDLFKIIQVRALQSAGVSFKPAKFGLATGDMAELERMEKKARQTMENSRKILDPRLRFQIRRMQIALATSMNEPTVKVSPEAEDLGDEILIDESNATPEERMRAAMRVLSQAMESLERLRVRFAELNVLLPYIRREGNAVALVRELRNNCKRTSDALRDVHQILMTAAYPYEHAEPGANISRFCCAKLPVANQVGMVHQAANSTLTAISGLYLRLLADMADRAERAETEMGLPPLEIAEKETGAPPSQLPGLSDQLRQETKADPPARAALRSPPTRRG